MVPPSIKMTVPTVYKLNITEGNSSKDALNFKNLLNKMHALTKVFEIKQADFRAHIKAPF